MTVVFPSATEMPVCSSRKARNKSRSMSLPNPPPYNFRSGSRATRFYIALIGGTCRVGGHCPSVVALFDHSLLRLNVSSGSEAIAYIFRIQPALPDFSRANGTWGNFHFLLMSLRAAYRTLAIHWTRWCHPKSLIRLYLPDDIKILYQT
jgi:hypothetical protein